MPQKRNDPLHGQQGFAMILVLCLGALFVALAAALVYAASLMLSNADRQLPEQDVYELAASFSDVLEQELLHYTGLNADGNANDDGSLGYFINNTYVRKGGIKNVYGEDTDHTFTLQAPAGVDELTVTLRKTLSEAYGETADESTSDSNILISYDIASNTDLQNLSEVMKSREQSYEKNGLADYDITVTVKATKDGESYAVTRKYRHTGKYKIYYTMDDGTGQWTFKDYQSGGASPCLRFTNAASQEKSVYANGNTTLHMRYHIEDGTPYDCTFTRITSND